MSFLKYLFEKDLTVNEAINRSRTEKGAVLLDVRRKTDYKKGYVAGSVNVPITNLENMKTRVKDLNTPIYVIGSVADTPKKAVKELRKMGYTNVTRGGYMEDHYGLLKK